LVQIALGKSQDAVAMLGEAQSLLDPADLGLALALAGRASDAVAVLEPASRLRGADARTRQNLALAYALGGDWAQARIVAEQDLAADQVDARMAEWLAMAKPGQASAQVAAFIGIRPLASDPGQPIRLALNAAASPTRQAAVEAPMPAPVAAAALVEAAPQTAEVAPPTFEAPVEQAAVVAPAPMPMVETAPLVETIQPAPRKVAIRAPRPALTPRRGEADPDSSRTSPQRRAPDRRYAQPRGGPARCL